MSGVVLCVGALSLDTIFRLDRLPDGPGKFLPLDAVEVVQGMASAQAATVARLGGRARLWASAGDDARGERLVTELAAEGIDCGSVRRVAGARSGFSSIFMDAAGERMIVPRYDPALAGAPEALPAIADVAVVSADVRWPAAAEMALRAARERGIPGVLDLEKAAPEVLERLLPLASHVIASEAGALQVTGMSPQAAVESISRRCTKAQVVAVTAGEKGVFWSGGHMPAFRVDAVDTLAAGDVFHGAFAFGLAEGFALEAALRFASAAAAIKCTRFGGRLGAPTRDEVGTMLA